MLNQEIQEVELSMAAAKEAVAAKNAALKLSGNREFKKLVIEGYFRDEAARLALLSSDPNMPPEAREMVARDINGVGAFQRYLQTIVRFGEIAERELEEHRETLDELRAEEAAAEE